MDKKDSKLNFSNYCKISLLSNIENILERLMCNRIYSSSYGNNLYGSLQFGFRQKHPTVSVFINLTENIRKILDDGNFGCGIFLHLQKAFGTLKHGIILSKLEHYCACALVYKWFKSDLSNGKYVSIAMILILLM